MEKGEGLESAVGDEEGGIEEELRRVSLSIPTLSLDKSTIARSADPRLLQLHIARAPFEPTTINEASPKASRTTYPKTPRPKRKTSSSPSTSTSMKKYPRTLASNSLVSRESVDPGETEVLGKEPKGTDRHRPGPSGTFAMIDMKYRPLFLCLNLSSHSASVFLVYHTLLYPLYVYASLCNAVPS